MNRALSFVKLDFITIKPYITWKNLLILTAVAVIMTWGNSSSAAAVGFIMVFGAIYVSYPFAVGEKNGIDALYVTLSIGRNTVVLGRYLFALLCDLSAGALAFVISLVLFTALKQVFNVGETLITVLAIFGVYSFIQAFQLPIFFKLGYAKAKFFTYLPFIGWPLAVFLLSSLFGKGQMLGALSGVIAWLTGNPLAVVLIVAIVWLLAMIISYRLSIALYKKRDF